ADIVDAAQQTLYDVSTRKTSEEYHPLSELFESTFDELEAIEARGDAMAGIPTGFTDLDELTNGFMPGQMIIVAARPAMGKSTLALD
ncbi:replicative DNA helicase, partial [Salmonella enterica subsp. enterica serovar Derby]